MAKGAVVEDFRKFINKGSILELATGIIVGTAFTAIVNSMVNDIIMPLISSIINFDITSASCVLKPAVIEDDVVIKEAITLNYGRFLQNIILFLIIALSVYVALKVVKGIKMSYIKSQISYVKKLKKKHPEYFDEEDEFGTLLYERLKKEHPEEFKNEIAEEIEKAKKEAQKIVTPQEMTIQLLQQINDNLERMNLQTSSIEESEKIEETEE